MRQISLTLLTSLLVFLALPAVAGKLYQWTDENGEKYYSDRVPPEHARREHRRLNPQGIEIERREPAKTPEQLAREQELKQLRAEQQRILEEQRARDRVLLRTFRTEDDLLMARNGKLVAVDAQIKLADSNVKRLRTRLADLQARAAALERRGDAVNRNLLQNIDQLRDQIENNYRYIVTREQDKLAIRERFEQDLQRFPTSAIAQSGRDCSTRTMGTHSGRRGNPYRLRGRCRMRPLLGPGQGVCQTLRDHARANE